MTLHIDLHPAHPTLRLKSSVDLIRKWLSPHLPTALEAGLGYVFVDWRRGERPTVLVTDGHTIRQLRASELRLDVKRTASSAVSALGDTERGLIPWWMIARAGGQSSLETSGLSCAASYPSDETYQAVSVTIRRGHLKSSPDMTLLTPATPPRHAVEVSARELRKVLAVRTRASSLDVPTDASASVRTRRQGQPYVCFDVSRGRAPEDAPVLSLGSEASETGARVGTLSPLTSSVFLEKKDVQTSGERTRVWVQAKYLRSCANTSDPRIRLDLRGALDIVFFRPTLDRLASEPSRIQDLTALMPVRA